MKTYIAKPNEADRRWYVVDAAEKTLGRTATEIARVLQGKHKPEYTPHVDTGDCVIVINAEKIRLTGNKLDGKMYHRHTGYMGGLVSVSARELLAAKPTELMRMAVKGMLPKSKLGRSMIKKLKVHAGEMPAHGYVAQRAEPMNLDG